MSDKSFDNLVEDLLNEFSIDSYLSLRKLYPDRNPPLQMFIGEGDTFLFAGIDIAFQREEEFAQHGITIEHYIGTLDGNENDIDKLCVDCLKALSERERLSKENSHVVGRGEAIGDAFINFIIGVIFESIASYELDLPPSFQVLVKERLGLFDNKIKTALIQRERKMLAAQLISSYPNESQRTIAKIVGVNVSTISNWMKEDDFIRRINAPSLLQDKVDAYKLSKMKVLPEE